MRKEEMVERIAKAMELTKRQADTAVEAVLAAVKEALRQGETVTLRGVGTWQSRAKQARVGRNPKTGAPAAIPARRVVRFTAGKVLKHAVAGGADAAAAPGRPGAPGSTSS
jgi:nucleoid DNA-binding protein